MTASLRSAIALTFVAALSITVPALGHGNPRAEVAQAIGHAKSEARINYSRPQVKGRAIWGDLVPYDQLWRTGADQTTTLTVSGPLKINDVEVPAGTYGLFTIPGEAGWVFVISKQSNLMGSRGYDPAQDLVRVEAEIGDGEHQEYLSFTFENSTNASSDIVLRWASLTASFTIRE